MHDFHFNMHCPTSVICQTANAMTRAVSTTDSTRKTLDSSGRDCRQCSYTLLTIMMCAAAHRSRLPSEQCQMRQATTQDAIATQQHEISC